MIGFVNTSFFFGVLSDFLGDFHSFRGDFILTPSFRISLTIALRTKADYVTY